MGDVTRFPIIPRPLPADARLVPLENGCGNDVMVHGTHREPPRLTAIAGGRAVDMHPGCLYPEMHGIAGKLPITGPLRHTDPLEAMALDYGEIISAMAPDVPGALIARGWRSEEIIEHLPDAASRWRRSAELSPGADAGRCDIARRFEEDGA